MDLVDGARFAAHGYPDATWTRLRAEAPVCRLAPVGWQPFWAVTRHADIQAVARAPERFSNEHGLVIMPEGAPGQPSEMIVTMDPPRHGPLRNVAIRRFTPRAVRERQVEIERITDEILDGLAAEGIDEFDFVERVAAPLPIGVISWLLGVPASDWQLLFRWTNEIIGKDDPEFRRPGESPGQTLRRARGELHAYLEELIATRRADPGDDVVSHLLASEIDGAPLTERQILNYAELMVEAGNETTRNAVSGGLLALAEHPNQWATLQAEPELLPSAVEEMLRWVSPIIHFTRRTLVDSEVHGVTIPAGDTVALFFASGNRDEAVFDDPFAFRVDRAPNPHLAFGFGTHFCMGAHLARVELETIYRHLLTRLESFEVTGPVERLASHVNGGFKHLPVRCRLR
jgi:cytochrome P450